MGGRAQEEEYIWQKRMKNMNKSFPQITATWNAFLNKRFPEYASWSRGNMEFQQSCNDLIKNGKCWIVINSTGVLVRAGESIKTPEAGRLKPYAFIEELARKGARMQVKLLRGWGPQSGWIIPEVKGKYVIERLEDVAQVG